MFLVYYISMVGVGAAATDWANDGLFGDGWHLFGIDDGYAELSEDYGNAVNAVSAFTGIEFGEEYESEEEETAAYEAMLKEMKDFTTDEASATVDVEDEETLAVNTMTVYYSEIPSNADKDSTVPMTYKDAVKFFEKNGLAEPDPQSTASGSRRSRSGRQRTQCNGCR